MAAHRQARLAALLLALTGALIAAALAAGSSPAQMPLTWRSEPGYDAVNSELWLVTSSLCGWTGGTAVTNENNPDIPATSLCGGSGYYWAPKCTAAAQTFTMTRKLNLVGPPAELEVSLVSLGNHPLKAMQLEVNGQLILNSTHSVHKANLKGKASAFKFGLNVIKIVAQKPATKAPCNSATTDTGVLLGLHAKFRADLAVTLAPKAEEASARFIAPLTITNKGPSWANYVGVSFGVGTSHLINANGTAILIQGAGLQVVKDCPNTDGGGWSAHCVINEPLAPGETFTLTVQYGYDGPPTGNFYEGFTRSWGAQPDTLDPNQTNNGGTQQGTACRQTQPPPCVKP